MTITQAKAYDRKARVIAQKLSTLAAELTALNNYAQEVRAFAPPGLQYLPASEVSRVAETIIERANAESLQTEQNKYEAQVHRERKIERPTIWRTCVYCGRVRNNCSQTCKDRYPRP